MNATEKKSQRLPPSAMLLQMMAGFWVSSALYAVAKLGLPDELKDGPRTVDDVAQKIGAHPGALYRLLRALGSVGIFTETESRRFSLTSLGEYLRSDFPGSLRSYVVVAKEMGWEPWGHLLHSIKSNETAFEHVHGMRYFEYLKEHSDLAALFNEAMTGFVTTNGLAVAAAYDFASISKVVDVGAGHGALTAAILARYPKTGGLILDLPHVVDGARKKIADAGLSGRCECIAGDFFESVPAGGDAYLLASVIHDWDDDRAITILKNCRRAMPQNARLFVIEMVIPPGDTPFFGKLLDLMMLVNLDGRERTEDEYRALLSAADFRVAQIIPTETPSSIIEAFCV